MKNEVSKEVLNRENIECVEKQSFEMIDENNRAEFYVYKTINPSFDDDMEAPWFLMRDLLSGREISGVADPKSKLQIFLSEYAYEPSKDIVGGWNINVNGDATNKILQFISDECSISYDRRFKTLKDLIAKIEAYQGPITPFTKIDTDQPQVPADEYTKLLLSDDGSYCVGHSPKGRHYTNALFRCLPKEYAIEETTLDTIRQVMRRNNVAEKGELLLQVSRNFIEYGQVPSDKEIHKLLYYEDCFPAFKNSHFPTRRAFFPRLAEACVNYFPGYKLQKVKMEQKVAKYLTDRID